MPGGRAPHCSPASSQWATDGVADTYDPDAARELVAQAKADGFDGRISFTTRNAPEARERALALQAQLAAVGIEMELDLVNSVADQVRVTTVDRDFDLAQSGLNIRDREPLLKLYSTFHSQAVGNISGYASPAMDALLTALQTAPTEQDKAAVLAEIEDLMADEVPAIIMAAQDNMVAWQPGVHDVVHSFGDIVLLGRAWIEP